MSSQQRGAHMWCAGEQLVDKGIFGLADRQMVEAGHLEEAPGIVASGMGGVEHHRRKCPPRLYRFEGRPIGIVGLHFVSLCVLAPPITQLMCIECH